MAGNWRETATDLRHQLDDEKMNREDMMDEWSSKIDQAARLHDELANELVETQRKLRAADGHNICDQVKQENDKLRAELAEVLTAAANG